MAGAGFLFTPHEPGDDTARCFYCNIELSGWEPNDDPVYVLLISPVGSGLMLLERNTDGGLQNVARNAPSSLQESRNFLRRRRPFAKPRLKPPCTLRRRLELVPPKSLIQNQILMTKRTTLGGVPVLGQLRQQRLLHGPLLEALPLPSPELHLQLRKQTNLVGATWWRSRSPKPRVQNEKRRMKQRRLKRMTLKKFQILFANQLGRRKPEAFSKTSKLT